MEQHSLRGVDGAASQPAAKDFPFVNVSESELEFAQIPQLLEVSAAPLSLTPYTHTLPCRHTCRLTPVFVMLPCP